MEASAAAEFLAHLRATVNDLRVGDPLDAATQMGPLISMGQRDAVHAIVSEAPVAFQGTAPAGPGFWYPPTVLYPIDDRHPAATDEIFGPVVSILTFDTEAEVIRRANDTPYGLSGSISLATERVPSGWPGWSSPAPCRSTRTRRFAYMSTPFGGFKQSGIGRELGPDALESYTELKNVFYNTKE